LGLSSPVAPKKAAAFCRNETFSISENGGFFSMATASISTPRVDIYTRVTNRIVEQLEQGIRPWMQPWNAEHAAGRITRPLRHNGEPYKGSNILPL
jgi:N-terminal domain of anti-restriction factor ArdC